MKKYILFLPTIFLLAIPISISIHLKGNSFFNVFIIFPIFTLILSLIQFFYINNNFLIYIKYLIPIIVIGFYGYMCLLFLVMFPIGIVCIITISILILLFNYELRSK